MATRTAVLGALAALAVTLALPATADAFCRMSTCQANQGQNCGPDPDNASCQGVGGKMYPRLFWSQPCVGFSIQQDTTIAIAGTASDRYALVEKIANTAFASWQNASCAGGPPTLAFADLGPVVCNKHEYNPSPAGAVAQGNANILLFRTDTWPYPGAANVWAITTDTYNTESGEIYDADIEINAHPQNGTLTTGDTNVSGDLLSILTHEAGHFLGLGHSPDPGSTMYFEYKGGNTSLRTLHEDDVAGVCALYPSTRVNLPACDPTPRHGYSSECAETTTSPKGCAASPGPAGAFGGLAALSALAMAAAFRRRRAR